MADKMNEDEDDEHKVPEEERYFSEGGTRYSSWAAIKAKMQHVLKSFAEIVHNGNDEDVSFFLDILHKHSYPKALRIVLCEPPSHGKTYVRNAMQNFCLFLLRSKFSLSSFALIVDDIRNSLTIGCYGAPAGKFASLNLQECTPQIVCQSFSILSALFLAYKDKPLDHLELILDDRLGLLRISMQPVAFAIASQTNLNSLTLANLNLGHLSGTALTRWINSLPNLHSLFLSGYGYQGFLEKTVLFNQNRPKFLNKLQKLVIENTYVSLNDIMITIQKCPQLSYLTSSPGVYSRIHKQIEISDYDQMFHVEVAHWGDLDQKWSLITLHHQKKYQYLTTVQICECFPFSVYLLMLSYIYPHLDNLRNITTISCLTKPETFPPGYKPF